MAKDPAVFNTGISASSYTTTGSIAATNVGEYGSISLTFAADGNASTTVTYRHTYSVPPIVNLTSDRPSAFDPASVTLTVDRAGSTTSCVVYAFQGWPTSTLTASYNVAPHPY